MLDTSNDEEADHSSSSSGGSESEEESDSSEEMHYADEIEALMRPVRAALRGKELLHLSAAHRAFMKKFATPRPGDVKDKAKYWHSKATAGYGALRHHPSREEVELQRYKLTDSRRLYTHKHKL